MIVDRPIADDISFIFEPMSYLSRSAIMNKQERTKSIRSARELAPDAGLHRCLISSEGPIGFYWIILLFYYIIISRLPSYHYLHWTYSRLLKPYRYRLVLASAIIGYRLELLHRLVSRLTVLIYYLHILNIFETIFIRIGCIGYPLSDPSQPMHTPADAFTADAYSVFQIDLCIKLAHNLPILVVNTCPQVRYICNVHLAHQIDVPSIADNLQLFLGPIGNLDPTEFINGETNRILFRFANPDLSQWKGTFKSWPSAEITWPAWFKRMRASKLDHWLEIGISQALALTAANMARNEPMMIAAAYFWSTAMYAFLFSQGPMTPTLLDIIMITGLDITSSANLSSLDIQITHCCYLIRL
uniref:Aminotransferase-like plant mobile domain-containing protein n=1 Tax=Oryza sativa subsp. japonica TaxID=39947 RepID=Q75HR8_ORYSJ|nr:hypothetical protein [Oryza sativa Japonica Group]